MTKKIYGVIDVGSNSVRLMLSDGCKTLSKTVKTTRLAQGMVDGVLQADAIERTANAVSFFYKKAKTDGANEIYVFATAAVRSANNGHSFVRRVKDLCGADVDVVSGEDEAVLGYKGALGNNDGGVIDVGGASTEIIICKNQTKIYGKSIYLGAVKTTDECGQDFDCAKAYVKQKINEFGIVPKSNFYTVGGTATSIAAMLLELEQYDAEKVNGYEITIDNLTKLTEKLYAMTVEERRLIKGLQPDRAEVIANGALILLEITKKFDIDVIKVSESDNLEGYLMIKRKFV